MQGDRLDPVHGNSPLDRARLLNQAPAYLARCRTRLLALLGLDEDAAWRAESGRDERGWTPDERQRIEALRMGGDVPAARTLLARHHGPAFVRHLLATGRIGEGS